MKQARQLRSRHRGQSVQAIQARSVRPYDVGQATLALGPGRSGHTSQAIQARLVRPCNAGQATQAQVSLKTVTDHETEID